MGLDQYAYAVRPHANNTDFEWGWEAHEQDYDSKVTKIAQWRKHSDLQGWMENLWLTKRTVAGDPPQPEAEGWFAGTVVFNCDPIRITLTDLEQLETAVNRQELPETTGFFFGQSGPEDKADDLLFIANARKQIADGLEIYYTSWW